MSSNEEQIRFWNEQGDKWVEMHERLDTQLGPIGDSMLEIARAQPGERVMDIGCGCGETSLQLARAVGPEGHVTGIDISAPMLAQATLRAKEAGLHNVSFERADAQVEAFTPGETDLLTSRFGVMFFADPVAAFANLRSALRSGGRLAFVCWQPITANPWMLVPAAAALPLLPEAPPPPDPTAPGPFAFGDGDRVRGILDDAGFANIKVEASEKTLILGGGAPPEETVAFVLRMGPVGRFLQDADDALIAKAHDAVSAALEPYRNDKGIEMTYGVWLVSATKD